MYSIVKTIPDVDNFSIGKNYYCYFLKTQELVVSETIFKISNEKILGAYLSENNLLYVTTDSQKYYYHISNVVQLLFKSSHSTGLRLLRDANGDFLSISENFEFELFDLEQRKVVQKFKTMYNNYEPLVLNNNTIYIHPFPENRIKSINLETGTSDWEVDLGDYCKVITVSNEIAQGMIRQVFGVFENKLWIGFDQSKYAALDLSTGKVLTFFKLSDIDADLERAGVLFPYFDAQRGLLCFLENRDYVEISLSNLSIHRRKSFDTGNPETDWNFSSNTFDDTNVYFTATRANSRFSPNYVGVFDRKTMEITWSQDLELYKQPSLADMPDRFLAQAPQSDGNKLYVLDTHNTLHIFEKEENS